MDFKGKEIKFFLKMYPIAKVKCTQLNHHLYKGRNNSTLVRYLHFYELIVEKVETWLKKLTIDEQEVINLRYFKDYSLDKIAICLGYANHSTILYKDKKILKKIERSELQ